MNPAARRALVALLARLPQCASFDGRTALLTGLAGEVRRSESLKTVDLNNLVEDLFALGGDGYLRALIDNARLYAAGTPLDADLDAAANALAEGVSREAPSPRLRDALAELCPTLPEARVLCADCGLDLRAIDLSGSTLAFWTAIVKGALEQNALGVLVARAREAFPKSAALAQAANSAGAGQPL